MSAFISPLLLGSVLSPSLCHPLIQKEGSSGRIRRGVTFERLNFPAFVLRSLPASFSVSTRLLFFVVIFHFFSRNRGTRIAAVAAGQLEEDAEEPHLHLQGHGLLERRRRRHQDLNPACSVPVGGSSPAVKFSQNEGVSLLCWYCCSNSCFLPLEL